MDVEQLSLPYTLHADNIVICENGHHHRIAWEEYNGFRLEYNTRGCVVSDLATGYYYKLCGCYVVFHSVEAAHEYIDEHLQEANNDSRD